MNLTKVEYKADVALAGYLADGSRGAPAPGVLIAHEAPGLTEQVKRRALMLAELGYVAFALDLYGQSDLPIAEAQKQSQAVMADARKLRQRARAALDVLAAHPNCDSSRIAAIGFCLGGIVALELARDEAPIQCAVAFHPGLMRPVGSTTGKLSAKILAMCGESDPVVSAEDRANFIQEMTAARADWQLLILGGVGHSYTNPEINALGLKGFAYDRQADRRAWRAMLNLFDEVF